MPRTLLALALLCLPLALPRPEDEPRAPGARALRFRVDVPAAQAELWSAWTAPDALATWFAPAANVELRSRGAYELLFFPDAPAGLRGAEGNLLLALQEPEFLSFTWDAPPHLSEVRRQRTSVSVRLEPLSPAVTRVWFEQTGWGRGGQWDAAFDYFAGAWPTVLARLQRRFAQGPLDWQALPDEEPARAAVATW